MRSVSDGHLSLCRRTVWSTKAQAQERLQTGSREPGHFFESFDQALFSNPYSWASLPCLLVSVRPKQTFISMQGAPRATNNIGTHRSVYGSISE
ncbi:hypothetical protein MPNT_50032 [Candidatus Methylacidithermus pantelleriae]|uniref:Uncharacterized protein n=1 Tax=Candidatus Methylacidithermus pantelleriae TaxID=2744239 RepID=A0A8J2BUR9_9BACT|nr:hypothetical protein MPNT_50032 [Candidatus Methylacidithermus pantelleriae]